MITEAQLRAIPRDELERLEVFPLPQVGPSAPFEVLTIWDPNDKLRCSHVRASLQRFVGDVEFSFGQPRPDPRGFVAAAMVARYEREPTPAHGRQSRCSVCGLVGERRIVGARASICQDCLERPPAFVEAARTLGLGRREAFWKVELPLARPAIAGGIALALMETLADFGAVAYFELRTFTTGAEHNAGRLNVYDLAGTDFCSFAQFLLAIHSHITTGDDHFSGATTIADTCDLQKLVQFDELVREAAEDAEVLAQPGGIQVQLARCDAVMVIGDRHRLRQVLLNLVDNAIKYNDSGGRVEISLQRDGEFAELVVTNTGKGIAPEGPWAVVHREVQRLKDVVGL